jgi:outer membrane protein assembly factor BamB
MKTIKNKFMTFLIALLLMTSFSSIFVTNQMVDAHTPPWQIPTYAFIKPTPNPVGVGQPVTVVMWLLFAAPTATGIDAGDRWKNLKVTVTNPNGADEVLGTFMADATGSMYTTFTPTEIGAYTFKLDFPGQVLSLYHPVTGKAGANSVFINDTYLPSSATATLTVQQEQVRGPASYPLPTEYWTRPIEGQNSNWWTVASNWLGAPQIIDRVVQTDGIGPNSAHIMWTKPLQAGGVVGGSREGVEGNTFYPGMTYETKFNQPIIMNGKIYYELPRGTLGTGGGYLCVDLQTGEELFYQNSSRPSFGQLLDYETQNQHGVLPSGYLWASATGGLQAYDPLNGGLLLNLTNVPTGTALYTKTGEIVRYVLNYNQRYLALWNMSTITSLASSLNFSPVGKTANASTAFTWNVTIPDLPGTAAPAIVKVLEDNMILGRSTTFAGMMADGIPQDKMFTMWALSLKEQSRGQLMWIKNYSAPSGQITLRLGPVDPINRVFTVCSQEEMKVYGYSLDNGNLMWTSDPMLDPMSAYNRMGATEAATAYGLLFTCDYSGLVYAWSTKNGSMVWTYGNGGVPGNDTISGYTSAWGAYPLGLAVVADEKVYVYTTEHSPNAPLYKGAMIRCLDAYTGNEIWTLEGWGSGEQGKAADFALADGYLVYLNGYDMQIYCVGKGPSAMTVDAPMTAITQGSSLVIRGTITDIAAGTNQKEQAARFPQGVPAVSDGSMGDWMAYVYMQKPRPTDVIGVPVTISVVDANGNYRDIGTTTSDADGFFAFNWTPDISGQYTVYASFAGSESYWPSHAVTSFAVDAAAPTPSPYAEIALPPTEMYIMAGVAAIIVAVAIGFAITIMMLRKRP